MSNIKATATTLDRVMALDFKTKLHGTGEFYVLMVPEKPGLKASGSTSAQNLRGPLKTVWPEICRLNAKGYAAFAMVNTSDGVGTKDENMVSINALFIDYDGDDWLDINAAQLLGKFAARPHMVVRTSRGHYHVYWLFVDGAIPLAKFKGLQQRLAKKYGADEKVCNPARVMRMPGSLNHKKTGATYLARLMHCDKDLPKYELDRFVETMLGASGSGSVNSKQAIVKSATKKVMVNQLPPAAGATVPDLDLDFELEKVIAALASISPEDRDVWVKVGMALKAAFSDRGFQVFTDWSSTSSKFDYEEAKRQWGSFGSDKSNGVGLGSIYFLAKRGGYLNDTKVGPTDTAFSFSTEFVTANMAELKYDPDAKRWFTYVKGKWSTAESFAESKAKEYIKRALTKDSVHAIAIKYVSANGLKEILRLASSDPRCHVNPEVFNAEPNIIGVPLQGKPGDGQLGVIDLPSGSVRPALPSDYLTMTLGVPLMEEAECPLFRKFVTQITGGDTELADALQCIFGYVLFGHTKAQLMFVFVGSGSNGKGVLLNILRFVLGRYSTPISYTLIRQHTSNPNSASPAVAAIVGARAIVCSEFPKGAMLEESFVKNITGSDSISYRGNYSDQASFTPQGTLFLAANDFPRVSFDHEAMWRRMYPVHFKQRFSGDGCDPDLEDRLKTEASGILNWLVEGAMRYHQEGKIPWAVASTQYLEKLKRASDTVGNWLADCCKRDIAATAISSVAFASYKEHVKNQHGKPVTQKEFKEILHQKGFAPKRTKSANVFSGLFIKSLS